MCSFRMMAFESAGEALVRTAHMLQDVERELTSTVETMAALDDLLEKVQSKLLRGKTHVRIGGE